MSWPSVRDDLALVDGYHSPQVSVEVRLNTNEAPVPPPDEFSARLAAEIGTIEWNRYPERDAAALRERLAEVEGVEPAQVFAANGSNEVLQTALLTFGGAGREVLCFEPTYALHSHVARITGASVIEADRRPDFTIDAATAVALIGERSPAVTFMCSPNNPSGTLESADTIMAILEAVAASGGLLIVDEAYGQFAASSSLQLVAEDRPLLVTRTFSKTWSMAAVRLGYAVGSSRLIAAMDNVVLPYHLNAITQKAGLIALDFVDEMAERVAHIVEERGRLQAALAELDVDQFPSQANFILFRPRRLGADVVWQRLVDRSILVRNCSSWPGLEGCLRVTLGRPEENDRFAAALRDILEGDTSTPEPSKADS